MAMVANDAMMAKITNSSTREKPAELFPDMVALFSFPQEIPSGENTPCECSRGKRRNIFDQLTVCCSFVKLLLAVSPEFT
jgi:hypothetical protein